MQSFLERVGLGKLWKSSNQLKFGHELDLRGTGRLNNSERLVGGLTDFSQLAQAKINLSERQGSEESGSSGFSE